MRKNFITKIISVLTAAGCMLSIFSVTAGAAVIDEGFESVTKNAGNQASFFSAESLPSSYNSADLGYVTKIKDQSYNDCWAYAGLAAFESKLLKNGYNIEDMSVDHLNVWATRRLNGKGWQRTYTGDGYTYISAGYLTSWQGGAEQSDAGTIDLTKNLFGDDMPTDLTKYGTTAIKYLTSYNINEIKQSIIDNGGVFTSYATANKCYGSNNTAYFMPQSYTGSYTGHSIEIVGWDDNYSKNRFNGSVNSKPQNDGAWLVKNSWGNYNSLGGYFWISYEDKYVFGSKYDPSFTIEQVIEIDDKTKLNQNEIYGATYGFNYIDSNEITYINRFNFEDDFRTLDKVVFESECIGADYEIHYIPVNNNTPVNNKSEWTVLDSGVIDYKGYICCDIDNFNVPDTDGAIGITINTTALNDGIDKNSSAYVKNSIGVGEWLIKSNNIYSFLNESQHGESYIYQNNKITDLMDWYRINNNDTLGGTFVIKAVMRETDKVTLLGDADLDGKLSILDATLIQKNIVQLEELNDIQTANADVNKNGRIDINDATLIQKALAELD